LVGLLDAGNGRAWRLSRGAAALGGDDVAVRAAGDLIDPTVPGQAQQFVAGLGVTADQLPGLHGQV
jgi:hypothetical protein